MPLEFTPSKYAAAASASFRALRRLQKVDDRGGIGFAHRRLVGMDHLVDDAGPGRLGAGGTTRIGILTAFNASRPTVAAIQPGGFTFPDAAASLTFLGEPVACACTAGTSSWKNRAPYAVYKKSGFMLRHQRAVDVPEQCCGVCRPTLTPRFGSMFIQIDGSTARIAQPVGCLFQAVRGSTCRLPEGADEAPRLPVVQGDATSVHAVAENLIGAAAVTSVLASNVFAVDALRRSGSLRPLGRLQIVDDRGDIAFGDRRLVGVDHLVDHAGPGRPGEVGLGQHHAGGMAGEAVGGDRLGIRRGWGTRPRWSAARPTPT